MKLPDTIDTIRPCVVQIRLHAKVQERKGEYEFFMPESTILGTGFFIHQEGYVITANHVIEYGEDKAKQYPKEIYTEFQVGLATPHREGENIRGTNVSLTIIGSFTMVQCDIVDRDIQHDLALLKLRANPFNGEVKPLTLMSFGPESDVKDVPWDFLYGLPVFYQERPKEGAPIAGSGYPFESHVLVTNSGVVASSWASHESSFSYRSKYFKPNDYERTHFYLADFQANPFNRGGPVYRVESGELIGMLSSSLESPIWDKTKQETQLFYDSGLSIVIPSKYILDFLARAV